MWQEKIVQVERAVQQQNRWRLEGCLNLIASENVMSERSRQLLASDFTHRYAEGHPGARYYEGTDLIDPIESETKACFQKLFSARHVEIRVISGTMSNDVVFRALVKPGDTVMVNALSSGGHISHQSFGALGRVCKNIVDFPRDASGYGMDVAKTKDQIRALRPALVVFGKSLFLFPEPVRELKEICEELHIRMMYDGAHVLGLIAGKQFQDPLFEGAEVLNGSTHKTFFGPQRGVILGNVDDATWKKIDRGAFPGATSNHHLHTLPPLLVSAYEMMAFGESYGRQVVANAQALAAELDRLGLDVPLKERGYTRSHQVVVDVQKHGGGGVIAPRLRENDIIVNRNLLPNDPPTRLSNPSGIRLGVQELTRFGMKEPEMKEIARLLKECIAGGASVLDEVHRFRSHFLRVHFSYDSDPASVRGNAASSPSVLPAATSAAQAGAAIR